jgi:hypothetical protein
MDRRGEGPLRNRWPEYPISPWANDDFGARRYTSRFGRWLSADWSSTPVAVPDANLTNPQTLNLYSRVSDDPFMM